MQQIVRRSIYAPFRRFLGGVRRDFLQRLFADLHGTLGSYLRDALLEESVMLSHAFLCLGLRPMGFVPLFIFLLGGFQFPPLFSLKHFWMCGDNSCNVFVLLFMVLWVLVFVTLCVRAVVML
jgi:hypothetical protein